MNSNTTVKIECVLASPGGFCIVKRETCQHQQENECELSLSAETCLKEAEESLKRSTCKTERARQLAQILSRFTTNAGIKFTSDKIIEKTQEVKQEISHVTRLIKVLSKLALVIVIIAAGYWLVMDRNETTASNAAENPQFENAAGDSFINLDGIEGR